MLSLRISVSIPLSRDSLCNFNRHNVCVYRKVFQSLYRGTAFATSDENGNPLPDLPSFNPSIEGQPLQPCKSLQSYQNDWLVSIPLSRDSLCNIGHPHFWPSLPGFQSLYRGTAFATVRTRILRTRICCFNPSIEGQPLQRCYPHCLWRRQIVSIPLSRDSLCNKKGKLMLSAVSKSFNPSIEGQPLQQSRCRSLDFQWLQQAVFLTYG